MDKYAHMDGISYTEISENVPETTVIIMSVQEIVNI